MNREGSSSRRRVEPGPLVGWRRVVLLLDVRGDPQTPVQVGRTETWGSQVRTVGLLTPDGSDQGWRLWTREEGPRSSIRVGWTVGTLSPVGGRVRCTSGPLTGWIVQHRWWLWSCLTNPRSLNRTVTMTVVGVIRTTDPRFLGRVDGPGGDDHRLIRRTSGFLVERNWTIVTAVACVGTSASCPCEPCDDDGDPGLLSGWTVERGPF